MAKKNYTHLLFDWDGCLAKTLQIHMKAYQKTFAEYDLHPSQTEIARDVFGDWEGALNVGLSRDDLDAFLAVYLERVNASFSNAELYPHAFEVIKHFSHQGKKLVLVTSSTQKHIHPALDKNKMGKFFDLVLAAEDVQHHKPDPEVIEKALALTKGEKDQAIIIGDSKSDLGAAQNAGIDSVLFFPKSHELFYEKKSLVDSYDPTFVISSHDQLLDLL